MKPHLDIYLSELFIDLRILGCYTSIVFLSILSNIPLMLVAKRTDKCHRQNKKRFQIKKGLCSPKGWQIDSQILHTFQAKTWLVIYLSDRDQSILKLSELSEMFSQNYKNVFHSGVMVLQHINVSFYKSCFTISSLHFNKECKCINSILPKY